VAPSPLRLLALVATASAAMTAVVVTAAHVDRPQSSARPATLLQLRAGAPAAVRTTLRRAGARLAVPSLRLWRLPPGHVAALRTLRSEHALTFSEPEHTYAVADVPADPLSGGEWWRAAIRIDTLTPPGPGVPVTLVDSGVFFGHQEFVGRPNLIALNTQEPAPLGGVHGTAVASVVGAPVNGVGLVGVYPEAVIRSYDASLGDGTRLPAAEIARGIVAAAQAGRSVINLSLGGDTPDPAIDAAVAQAVRSGSLVVAASGNSGDFDNAISYPGADPHVLTVGATDQNDRPASFTTRSSYVDLAAPGVDIPVASALDNSYQAEDGTSFSSPMVAGAAAWLWTARPTLDASQVAEILRTTARDVNTPGYDEATGNGILDVAAALAAPTPLADSPEPNDSVATATPLTTRVAPAKSVSGRVEMFEDPRDVYRIWLPARKRVAIRVNSTGVGVSLAGVGKNGKTFTFIVRNTTRTGHYSYVVVSPQSGVRDSTYTLTLKPS
jgi:subtilase family protein